MKDLYDAGGCPSHGQEFPPCCVCVCCIAVGSSWQGFYRDRMDLISPPLIFLLSNFLTENNDPPTILLTALVGRPKHRRSLTVLCSILHTYLSVILLFLQHDYCLPISFNYCACLHRGWNSRERRCRST